MPMTTRMAMMAETRNVSRRGALKAKFMMSPMTIRPALPCRRSCHSSCNEKGVPRSLLAAAASGVADPRHRLAVDEHARSVRDDRPAAPGLIARVTRPRRLLAFDHDVAAA